MKIGYSKTYPILASGQWEKIWIEDEVTGTEEDARKLLYSLKKQVENFHYESNKAAEKQTGQTVTYMNPPTIDIAQKDAEDKMILGSSIPLEEQINSCLSIKVLESYKFIVKGKPELEAAYSKRLKELT